MSLTLAAVSVSGSNATYTFTHLSDYLPSVGSTVAIVGMTDSVNNGTFVVTAFGSGTFTVANSSAVAATGQSGSADVTPPVLSSGGSGSSTPTSRNYSS
jgi:hypothetical protein